MENNEINLNLGKNSKGEKREKKKKKNQKSNQIKQTLRVEPRHMTIETETETETGPDQKKPRLDSDTPKMATKALSVETFSLLVKKLSEKATVPTRGSSHSAGYDLYR